MSPEPTCEQSPYLPENSSHFFTLQMMAGDRRAIAPYQGRKHVPFCIKARITKDDCVMFFDGEAPVTFTVRVPLSVVVRGAGATIEHIRTTAFDFPVGLHACEFRPVGATIADFDEEFSGDVLLQVTCAISACT